MKIRKFNANLSNIYKLDNFSGIIKQIKPEIKWTRGGIVVANSKECIENSVSAHELFPKFFPKITPLANDTYLRDFVNSLTLDESPQSLNEVIVKMFSFHRLGVKKLKGGKNVGIHRLGELWKKGFDLAANFLELKNYKSVLTYNIGDAKASNLLAKSKYLTFDSEGFSIGDISTDIISLIETYQYRDKMDLLKKTLDIVKLKYTALDENIIEKSLLGLIGVRSLEVNIENRDTKLLKESINLFKSFIASSR